jgi:hypothetical protein
VGDQWDLLEELARVYARAAVDEFLALLTTGNFSDGIPDPEGPSGSPGCKVEEDPTHPSMGRNP